VANRINQKEEVSRDFSLFNQQGTSVVQGNLLVVPIGDSFLYFEPIYLRATGVQSLPELKRVILVDSQKVVYRDTLENALNELVGQPTQPVSTPPPGPSPSPGNTQVAALVAQANQHYAAAQDALKRGDFVTYAQEMQQVGQILQQLAQLTGASAAPSPIPSPSKSP
jgi:uncharacterized membrane protein (UPF0182 family)